MANPYEPPAAKPDAETAPPVPRPPAVWAPGSPVEFAWLFALPGLVAMLAVVLYVRRLRAQGVLR